ncbi:MAG: hypothetical protein ACOZNI_34320 [Myxococcota bacterium]
MTRRILVALALTLSAPVALAVLAEPAHAAKKEDQGVPVRVIVLDAERKPVSTAVVRHPQEADRHRVNSVDGSWEASVLYMPDGSELRFTPGMTLELEISAPGYTTQVFQYQVRKRKNVVEIALAKIEMDDTTIEEPMISFGRDEPREAKE